ncbi:MAG: alpha/beta hydrolase [Burkholderiales bacterium]|nr:alpha/beta hydrolase [Burkholderiales bacterium]
MTQDLPVTLKGSAGRIEAVISLCSDKPKGIAFINHPHPLFGGSMNNKVVHTMNAALLDANWLTVRHNFRGVGKSDGAFGNGGPETQDMVGIIEQCLALPQVQQKLNNLKPQIIYAGFSFGSFVACKATYILEPYYSFLVGTPPGKWYVPFPKGKSLLIHGQLDEIMPLNDVLEWAGQNSSYVAVIPGASHFFDKKLTILKKIVFEQASLI